MDIKIIAAVAENGVIGNGIKLPWRLPDDMKFFAETTIGHTVIMGRKSYDSIPSKFKPLPNRRNIVLTKGDLTLPGCDVFNSFFLALKSCEIDNDKTVFIIGGAEIYKLGLAVANTLLITEVKGDVEGDIYFPTYDKSLYEEKSRVNHPADEKHLYAFDFVIYEKIK